MDTQIRQTVTFIGSGNVATHLTKGLSDAGVVIDTIWSPLENNRQSLAELTKSIAVNSLLEISVNSDFYVIAVPDDKIIDVVNNMPDVKGVVAHTSGITPLSVISARFENSGVFYPLQTFSKSREVVLSNVPFCIEGNSKSSFDSLMLLAANVSDKVFDIHSDERKKLHLAAVFVSNFANHLYLTADEILKDNTLSFDLLIPLIEEVAAKVKTLSPKEAQTGPARRDDMNTISEHIEMLRSHPDFLELYQLITKQIIKRYHE